jgi:hypothetical protein
LLAGFIASGDEERVSKFSTLVSLQWGKQKSLKGLVYQLCSLMCSLSLLEPIQVFNSPNVCSSPPGCQTPCCLLLSQKGPALQAVHRQLSLWAGMGLHIQGFRYAS